MMMELFVFSITICESSFFRIILKDHIFFTFFYRKMSPRNISKKKTQNYNNEKLIFIFFLNKETSIYGFCFLFYLFNLIRNFRQFMLLLAIIQLK